MHESRTDRILRALLRAGKVSPELDTAKTDLGFETRLMATIRERKAAEESPWWLWNRLVWRAVPVLTVAVALLVCSEFLASRTDSSLLSWSDPLGFEQVLSGELGGWL